MIRAAARPGVETLRFRALTERSLPASMAPRQPRGGRRRPGSLDNVSAFASQSNILPEQDRRSTPGPRTRSRSAWRRCVCVTAPRHSRHGMRRGSACWTPCKPRHRAPDAAADAPCPTDAARSAWSERSLLRLPCRSRTRTAFRRGPVARMGSLIAGYALCPAAYAVARNGTPLSETAELSGGAFRRRPPNTRQSGNTVRARTAWTDYRSALAALSSEAGTSDGLVRLARSLYGGELNGALRARRRRMAKAVPPPSKHGNPDLRNDPLPLSLMRAPLLFKPPEPPQPKPPAIFSSAGQPK